MLALPISVVTGSSAEKRTVLDLFDPETKLLCFVIYPKAKTPGCTKQVMAFNKSLGVFHAAGVAVLGLSKDTDKAQSSFIEAQELDFGLIAEGTQLLKMLNCLDQNDKIVRSVVIINSDGEIVYEKHKVKPEESCVDCLEFVGKLAEGTGGIKRSKTEVKKKAATEKTKTKSQEVPKDIKALKVSKTKKSVPTEPAAVASARSQRTTVKSKAVDLAPDISADTETAIVTGKGNLRKPTVKTVDKETAPAETEDKKKSTVKSAKGQPIKPRRTEVKESTRVKTRTTKEPSVKTRATKTRVAPPDDDSMETTAETRHGNDSTALNSPLDGTDQEVSSSEPVLKSRTKKTDQLSKQLKVKKATAASLKVKKAAAKKTKGTTI